MVSVQNTTSDQPRLAGNPAGSARGRMLAIAGTAILFGIVTGGTDVAFPLWVTRDLGLSAAQWALLRGIRFAGVLVGVIFLGALSDRFGEVKLGVVSLVAAAATLAWMGLQKHANVWIAMPLFGAMVSTCFVNLNILTQRVSLRRQGLANSIYRSVGSGAQIVAPVIVTTLAGLWMGYPPVFLFLAVLTVLSAAALIRYPVAREASPWQGWRAEVNALWQGYAAALSQRRFMYFVGICQLWIIFTAGVGAFAAIRFTRDLRLSDDQFGFISGASGAAALAATAFSGLFLDRVHLGRFLAVTCALSGLASLAMGVTDSPRITAAAFILFAPLTTITISPVFMWISRISGACSQTALFSAQKVLSALAVVIGMILLGAAEGPLGIRLIWLWSGVLATAVSFLFLLAPEPPALNVPVSS